MVILYVLGVRKSSMQRIPNKTENNNINRVFVIFIVRVCDTFKKKIKSGLLLQKANSLSYTISNVF